VQVYVSWREGRRKIAPWGHLKKNVWKKVTEKRIHAGVSCRINESSWKAYSFEVAEERRLPEFGPETYTFSTDKE
jgi:hypothetical protein